MEVDPEYTEDENIEYEDIYFSDSEDEFEEYEVPRDDSKLVLKCHDEAVLKVIMNKAGTVGISGGMDDRLAIWRLDNGELMWDNKVEHSDTVTHIALSENEKFIASGDLEGLVIIWQIKQKPIRLHVIEKIEMLNEIIELKWLGESLYIGDKTGLFQTWNPNGINMKYIIGKGCNCSQINIINDKHVAVLYGGYCNLHEDCANQFELNLIDLETEQTVKLDLKKYSNNEDFGSSLISKCADNGSVLIMGDSNRLIHVAINAQGQMKTPQMIPIHNEAAGSIDCLDVCDSMNYLLYTTDAGSLVIYDLNKQSNRTLLKVSEGKCLSKWIPNSFMMVTIGNNAEIKVWDGRNPTEPKITYYGHSKVVWDCAVSPDCSKLLTGSEDSTCRLFTLQ